MRASRAAMRMLVMDGVSSDGAIVKGARVELHDRRKAGRRRDAGGAGAVVRASQPRRRLQRSVRSALRRRVSIPERGTAEDRLYVEPARRGPRKRQLLVRRAATTSLSYTYQPNVLPPHASFGEVTDRRSEVLPGLLGGRRKRRSNIKGVTDRSRAREPSQITFSDFRRFADLQSALRALPDLNSSVRRQALPSARKPVTAGGGADAGGRGPYF